MTDVFALPVELVSALRDRYVIEREIGRGGMAVVYFARDVRHDRPVAIKVLNPELAAVLGVERFLSEIRVTANLQHPNLLPLFDSGAESGFLFYVMPFVDGESLRARLDRERQLPIDEAVRIVVAVANALDHAHRHGVVHRDLKPDNILLQGGQPIVADFGIALAVSNAGGARVTATGLSLGTPQYMSPEQATADRVIDGRTDIYSLAAVMYEMLAGEPPHSAATSQGVIAKLMTEQPRPVSVLRPAVPPALDAAVLHALQKLPADRFATAREFGDAVQERSGTSGVLAAPRPHSRLPLIGALTLAGACAVVAAAAVARGPRAAAPQTIRFKLDLPAGHQIGVNPGASIAISADGRAVAYAALGAESPTLFVRRLDELDAKGFPLAAFPLDLKFTPDGRSISYVGTGGHVWRIPVDGGASTAIAQTSNWKGSSWGSDGVFVYADHPSLWRIDSIGGTPRRIMRADSLKGESDLAGPFVLPDGKGVMFQMVVQGESHLAHVTVNGGTRTIFDRPWANVLGFMDGWLIQGLASGTLEATRFDPGSRRFSGTPVTLAEGILWKPQGGAEAALSRSGTLVYLRGSTSSVLTLLDSRGARIAQAPQHGAFLNPAWSPDGKQIAVEVTGIPNEPSSIWIYDVESKAFSRLTNGINAYRPTWLPAGKRVAFMMEDVNGGSVWSAPADASAAPERMFGVKNLLLREVAFSSDSKYAVVRTHDATPRTKGDLYLVSLNGGGELEATTLVQSVYEEEMPAISPDSHWLAYASDETGRVEIYLRPFPTGGGRVQVSTDGGVAPRWTPDGTHLVYRSLHAMWSATISTTGPSAAVIRRDSLFPDPYRRTDTQHPGFDIARDGRFALFASTTENSDVVVVTNWWSDMQAKLRSK